MSQMTVQDHNTSSKQHIYAAIDLKSFYASVECMERGLDPMTTNLVVADSSKTEKTICLAVSPSLKSYGIPGRARLFEVVQQVKRANADRANRAPGRKFTGSSYDAVKLHQNPSLAIDYIAAPPQMALYMKCSTQIYDIYLKYIAPEDIHIYSVDEVFIDVTDYLETYQMTAHELTMKMIHDVLGTTGITATAGIGTNMYLCKIAMDILAKHVEADADGVRIAELDEMSYRKQLWNHRPLTDFWRVGIGYARKLEQNGLMTMGDVARCSVGKATDYYNEDLLYQLFGINAELLIDHAWGYEPCTIADIKSYKPENHSIGAGQVLQSPYTVPMARLIVKEMTDLLVLDLVNKKLVTDQIVLTVGYDVESLTNPDIRKKYHGEIKIDRYGREVPKSAHGTAKLNSRTSSTKQIMDAMKTLYDRIVNPDLLVRRVNMAAINVVDVASVKGEQYEQLDLFSYFAPEEKKQEAVELEKEQRLQQAMLEIKEKYGKNAILKGMNFEEGGTTIQRNKQIGGHKA